MQLTVGPENPYGRPVLERRDPYQQKAGWGGSIAAIDMTTGKLKAPAPVSTIRSIPASVADGRRPAPSSSPATMGR